MFDKVETNRTCISLAWTKTPNWRRTAGSYFHRFNFDLPPRNEILVPSSSKPYLLGENFWWHFRLIRTLRKPGWKALRKSRCPLEVFILLERGSSACVRVHVCVCGCVRVCACVRQKERKRGREKFQKVIGSF